MTLNLRDGKEDLAVERFLRQVERAFSVGARLLPSADSVATTAPYAGNAVLYLKRT